MKPSLLGAAAMLLSFSLPAVAATTDSFRYSGDNAFASFSVPIDNCNTRYVSISGFEGVTRDQPKAPSPQPGAFFSSETYNSCLGTWSDFSSGFSSDVSVNVDNQLKSGTISGTIPLYDDYLSDTTQTVEVSLSFSGAGDLIRNRSNYSTQSKNFTYNSRYSGTARNAVATGSVLLNGTNLIDNATLNYAELSTTRSGIVQITRP